MPHSNCSEPSNITIDLLGSTSILFSWEIEYDKTGFALGTGTVIQNSQTTFLIDTLVSGTSYKIYLRSNCGSEGFSEYSNTLVVTTNP